MEKPPELEIKYHKLATEYSKLKSQAMVLKKAVVDEQAKNTELKETINAQEQKLRKFNQETESLTFRNEQLTKRVSVLQQELQINSFGKKSKNKIHEHPIQNNFSVLDEELQNKIVENAALICTIGDKDSELESYKTLMESLQSRLIGREQDITVLQTKHKDELEKVRRNKCCDKKQNSSLQQPSPRKGANTEINWQEAAQQLKIEYEILKNQPRENKAAVDYYEEQLSKLLTKTSFAESESRSLWIEINALSARLDAAVFEKQLLEDILEKTTEELATSNNNYQSQLDAMTEHLASQNDKIAQQCDEIELLKHSMSLKK